MNNFKPRRNYRLTDQNKIDIVNLFTNNKYKICDLAKKFGVTSPAVTNILKVRGVITQGKRKDHFIENIFNKIDTEEKAYWLGFIYADGNIHKYTLCIELNSKDVEHLEKFKLFLGSSRKIEYRKNKPAARFKVHSKLIKESLAKHGIFPAKSKTITMPNINAKLEHHFWRGYWDGDGWISEKRQIFGTASLSKNMLKSFQKWIKSKGVKGGSLCQTTSFSCWQLAYENEYVPLLLKSLYENANIFLSRKEKIAKNIILNPLIRMKRIRNKKGQFVWINQ